MKRGPTGIHARIAELLTANPEGLTSGEIRALLGLRPDEHAQLDRRRRDLRKWYELKGKKIGSKTVYVLGPRLTEPADAGLRRHATIRTCPTSWRCLRLRGHAIERRRPVLGDYELLWHD